MTGLSSEVPSAADVLAATPPVRIEPEARQAIRASHARTGRRIAVLDDDPTGSQTVHDVSVVTVLDETEYVAALGVPGSTCFILTNTRSLPESSAVELTAMDATRRSVTGSGYDGILLIRSYFEAGRFTAGDIHWANIGGELVP